jgi:hypothetical protein
LNQGWWLVLNNGSMIVGEGHDFVLTFFSFFFSISYVKWWHVAHDWSKG